jgi:hypothetical protein
MRIARLSALVVVAAAGATEATQLTDITLDNVQVRYDFPDTIGGTPGTLTINSISDPAVTTLATEFGGAPAAVTQPVDIALHLELASEVGDAGDSVAQGVFWPGMFSVTQPGLGGAMLFGATIDNGLSLAESTVVPGLFAGNGTFSGAALGGDFAPYTGPTSGELDALLFEWFTDPEKTNPIDIDNFIEPIDDFTTVYARVTWNITPEPATFGLMLAGAIGMLGRRNKIR